MKYFTINELTKSETAQRKGINNSPNFSIKQALTALVDNTLDPLRESYGKPIIVTSGYRCSKLNTVVGGAISSQHVKGEAADIQDISRDSKKNKVLLKLLLNSNIPFDQVICEYPDAEGNPSWIHVSYTMRRANRKQLLTAVYEIKNGKKRTVYKSGIKL